MPRRSLNTIARQWQNQTAAYDRQRYMNALYDDQQAREAAERVLTAIRNQVGTEAYLAWVEETFKVENPGWDVIHHEALLYWCELESAAQKGAV